MIDFIIHIPPHPKGRPRFWNGRILTDKKTRMWEKEFSSRVRGYKPPLPLVGPLQISLLFQIKRPASVKRPFPHVRPDLDNYIKAVMDALKEFWFDDGQIVQMTAAKRYGDVPFIKVEIDGL